ncbi:MAG: TetR family transcriptional regulator C-terminal domain-containing protein [Bacteroidota bacterium]
MEKDQKTKKTKASDAKKNKIVEAYIEYILTHGKEPNSVFIFAKEQKMKEEQFYDYFNSFSALEKGIWSSFFEETKAGLEADETYHDYSVREKLLAFYYTWIEVLKANRSYVKHSFHKVKKLERPPSFLKDFKDEFIAYTKELIMEGNASQEIVKRPYISDRYAEGLWLQLLFVLRFWLKDDSQAFEKTDAAIEKAVNLSLDLMGRGPVDTMIDFAKFLYHNR